MTIENGTAIVLAYVLVSMGVMIAFLLAAFVSGVFRPQPSLPPAHRRTAAARRSDPWDGARRSLRARRVSKLADRRRSFCKFMPTPELCRTDLEPSRRSGVFASRRADFVPVP